MEIEGGAPLAETPTYALAIVIIILVALGAFFQSTLEWSAKWLEKNKRKGLVAAVGKIKDELMLFGLLSLLMGHWIAYFAKICIKSSTSSSRFYPCMREDVIKVVENVVFPSSKKLNESGYSIEVIIGRQKHCPKGHEPFVSYESLEQLHRLLFALVIIHVSYSFAAISLAITKIYSWRTWENHAKRMTIKEGFPSIFHHTLHPLSKDRVLVWLLCFGRQFWSSINQVDYMAMRLGFITTHKLPLSYDFHNYMVRTMDEEFSDIVGISVPFWIYAICCILLNFHGTNVYFWFSFLPAVLILLVGTKLHRVVAKLAVEIRDYCPATGHHYLNLRDEFFWFGKPKLLLWLVQFITFQNAFEMATFIWSLWEIQGASCFMDNHRFLVIRLIFGVVSQFWCSSITFPLYVLVTQMGSSYKQALISENTRRSLSMWKQRASSRTSCTSSSQSLLGETSATSTDCLLGERARTSSFSRRRTEGGRSPGTNLPRHEAALSARGSHKTLEELIVSEDPYHCIPSSDDCSGDERDGERRP
ncbi:MLO-like protein 4 [Syzygium oleosum]|uniref:MLO-like protein 4 n=1 Tax=Syzygium oleosum TaxID=219896 RepID=UPI0011D232F3|nr:MLO-like protein 4 [Syzygium oleosum]